LPRFSSPSGIVEWFHSLLSALERQDTKRRISISISLTPKAKDNDKNNIFIQDVGAERDAIA
jgi:hypothetical protein